MDAIFLALDTASKKTGYAIYKAGKIIKSGTWLLTPATNYRDLLWNLEDTIDDYKVTQIVAEDVYRDKDVRKKAAYQVLCGCRSIVECIAQIKEVPITFMSAIHVERHLELFSYFGTQWPAKTDAQRTARREEKKKRMIRRMKYLGYVLETPDADDEADAIGLLITYVENCKFPLTHPD
jgi:Holliday junction resolvasome RuvABC endonuclease subunit